MSLPANFTPTYQGATSRKIIKFHGARSKLEAPIKTILAWCLNPELPDLDAIETAMHGSETTDILISSMMAKPYRLPLTAERALRMLRELYTEGFTAFG